MVVEEWGSDGGSVAVSYSPRAQIEAQLITALLDDAELVEDNVEWPIFYSPEIGWICPIRLFRYVW